MTGSKILLQFSVGEKKYGVIKDDRNSAVRYINAVADKLKQYKILQSLKLQNEDVCVITTDARKVIVTIRTLQHATYKVRYFVDDNYQKTFESDNVEQLVTLVHNRLDIDRAENYTEDIVGIWEQSDSNISEKYILSIDADDEQLEYMDILASIGTDVDPFSKLDLAELRTEMKLKHVNAPGIHCLSCYSWATLLGPLGIVIATILTVTYTNKIIKLYGDKYTLSKYISSITFWRVIGVVLGCASVIAIPRIYLSQTSNGTIQTVFVINPLAIITLVIMFIVGMSMNNKVAAFDKETH